MFAFNSNPTTTNTITSNPTTSKCRVKFDGKLIETTVTDKGSTIDEWVHEILSMYDGKRMVVGLDIEWKPNSSREDNNKAKAATLQLCTGEKCLIVQLLHTDCIPQPLKSFLMDSNFTFVGVRVAEDIAKLNDDYGIECNKSADVRELAMRQWPGRFVGKSNLKTLAFEVLGVSMKKPPEVRRSDWDKRVLDENQVEYACIDAYVSYRVGHKLLVESGGDNYKLLHMLGLDTASFKSVVFLLLLFYLFFILLYEWYQVSAL